MKISSSPVIRGILFFLLNYFAFSLNYSIDAFKKVRRANIRNRIEEFRTEVTLRSSRASDTVEISTLNSGAASLAKKYSLESIIEDMDEPEKYNAVLQGLAGMTLTSKGRKRYDDILRLLDEMATNGVSCDSRSVSMVIDASISGSNISDVSAALSLLRRCQALPGYSRELPRLSSLPQDDSVRIKFLKKLIPVPPDSRGEEMLHAGAFLSLISFDVAGNSLAPVFHWDHTIPTVITIATASYFSYDLLRGGGNSSRRVLGGLNRLFYRDILRESKVESASFLVAYLCGLPCFVFQPNLLEVFRMIELLPEMKESIVNGNGINRLLVWLMSSVAGESLAHRQLVASDPKQAVLFLRLARSKGLIRSDGIEDEESDRNAVCWAFNEAREILKQNERIYDKLREAFEMENATAGECVAIIEKYLYY